MQISDGQGRSGVDEKPNGPSHYFSQRFQKQAVKLAPCQMYITDKLDEMLETVLGSCVAACIRDPIAGVAGINHFMLPTTREPRSNDLMTMLRYGNHSMDLLIEGLLRSGAKTERLEVKVFGGANVMTGPVVGEANADWVSALSARPQTSDRRAASWGTCGARCTIFRPPDWC